MLSRTIVAGFILVGTITCLLPATSSAQTFTYVAGLSSSWGERVTIICKITCGEGSVSSAGNFTAPIVGAVLTLGSMGPLEITTGGFLAPRGWAVSEPTLRVVYLEIPVLVHLGFWPKSGFGAGLTAGIAGDVSIVTPSNSDVALVTGFRTQLFTSQGNRYSLSLRLTRGLNTIYRKQNHALLLLLGFSPSGDPSL